MPTKVCIRKAMVFSVVMYGCEIWTIRKAEDQRIDASKLRCWRRLLRVPWTANKSNQSILREINSQYSLEGLMLKLKLQYFGHMMWRADSLQKTLMLEKFERAGGEGGDRGWNVGRHHQLNGHESGPAQGDSEGQGSLLGCSSQDCRVRHDSNWRTTTKWLVNIFLHTRSYRD